MWCAYAFAALAFVSLSSAVASHSAVTLVSWVSQTFLQLVLLSVIIVGQNVLAAAADKRADATYNDADAMLHEVVTLQRHLAVQDRAISATTSTPAAAICDVVDKGLSALDLERADRSPIEAFWRPGGASLPDVQVTGLVDAVRRQKAAVGADSSAAGFVVTDRGS